MLLFPQLPPVRRIFYALILPVAWHLFFFAGALSAAEKYTVSGHVTRDATGIAGVSLALLKFIKDAPPGTPPMAPIGTTKTDAAGYYQFTDVDGVADDVFVVGILFEGKRESSDRFSFKESKTHTVNFSYDAVKVDVVGDIYGKLMLDGNALGNARMTLFKMVPDPQEGPPVVPVETITSDDGANYRFSDVRARYNDVFVIGVQVSDNDRRVSGRIGFDADKSVSYDINFPGVSTDASHFVPLRSSIILTYFIKDHGVRVTDFTDYENTSGKILDLRDHPAIYALPAHAVNPVNFPVRKGLEEHIVFEHGIIKAGIYSDSPMGRLVYEYDITTDVESGMTIEIPIKDGTREIEIIYPLNALTVSLGSIPSVETVRDIQTIAYGTRSIKISPEQKTLSVTIDSLPIKQSVIAAYAGVIVSVPTAGIALVYFGFRRKKAKHKNAEPSTDES